MSTGSRAPRERARGEANRPRLLAIVGSGETTPTMSRLHRRLAARLGSWPAPGVVIDTPYGFQENADEISARALEYFERNVGLPMVLAPLRRADEDPLLRATAMSRVRDAGYVFSGPGSPSYALRQWQATDVPRLVAAKLDHGGVVVFASAAALTLGAWTVPVYEIYKSGEEPRWLPGLDLLAPLGLPVAVIPHYDNAEGGTHDTRFCYLGETRLAALEAQLPETHFVLGVDSHTALVLDLAARTASVSGLGTVTVRAAGRSWPLAPESEVPIDELARIAADLRAGAAEAMASAAVSGTGNGPAGGQGTDAPGGTTAPAAPPTHEPLLDEVRGLEARFEAAMAEGETDEALRAVLGLEDLVALWSLDTAGTDELDRSRAVLHALIVRLTGLASATSGAASPPPVLVDLLVEVRSTARAGRDYELGDRVRDALLACGIEVHDGPDGTTWTMRTAG